MKAAAKIQSDTKNQFVCGLFSKKEAAEIIAEGGAHIHSTTMGYRDELAKVTRNLLNENDPKAYPWEHLQKCQEVTLRSSAERYKMIKRATVDLGIFSKRGYAEKVECVLEELITNGIYHAYRKGDGSIKYWRDQSAELEPGETLKIRYQTTPEGIYLSVEDQGGRLKLEDIGKAFFRCYHQPDRQIEEKEQGPGLGLYMVFDLVTHFRVDVTEAQKTLVSCWLADRRVSHPSIFSFNYFQRG